MIDFFRQLPSVLNQAVAWAQIAHISHSTCVRGARNRDSDVLLVEQAEVKSVFWRVVASPPCSAEHGNAIYSELRRSPNGK
jgi:hypothetical protein